MERGCYVLISDVQNPLLAINGRMVGGRYNGGRRKDTRKRQSSPTSQSPVIQRLDFLDSFFFLAAGDLDLERLDREELRWVLPGDRDLDRRRLDVELLRSHHRERIFLGEKVIIWISLLFLESRVNVYLN